MKIKEKVYEELVGKVIMLPDDKEKIGNTVDITIKCFKELIDENTTSFGEWKISPRELRQKFAQE